MSEKKGIVSEEEVLYQEYIPIGKLMKNLFILVLLVITIVFTIILFIIPTVMFFMLLILICTSVFILFVYLSFKGLKILITSRNIDLKYGIFIRKVIPLKEIGVCEISKTYYNIYFGIGIRHGLDGSWAFNTDFGEAVKLIFKNGGSFLFSTKNPSKICDLINSGFKSYSETTN